MRWMLTRMAALVAAPAALLVTSLVLVDNLEVYPYQVLVRCGIYVTLAVSLNLINGITGQFSIGHAGFVAVGAYLGAAWTVLWQPLVVKHAPMLELGTPAGDALNLLIAVALGAVGAAIAGFVVGLPSLRLRGDYLAIVTLGFGEVIRVALLNIQAVGGARGLSGLPSLLAPRDGGLLRGAGVFWVYLLVIAVIAVSRNLMQSIRGLTYLAVREDETAADAMGVNTTQVKVSAFVIGSAFAGAAGVMLGHFTTGISPDMFGMDTSIIITTMVVLGGTGSVTGSVISAMLLTALPEVLRFMQEYRLVIFSTMLVILMLTRPQGIFGTREVGLETVVRLFRRRGKGAAA